MISEGKNNKKLQIYGYTDIHMHIIPDVDDGANDMKEALSMLEKASSEGIKTIIATPHSGAFDGLFNPVKKRYEALKEIAREKGITIDLRLGAEICVGSKDIKSVIRNLKKKKYPTMNGTGYVLIEFDLCTDDFCDAEFCVSELTERGYTPIIAHAERYSYTVDQIYELAEIGCLIQVNYSDVLPGQFKSSDCDKANKMLKDQRVDFLSTDAHGIEWRKPEIQRAIVYLYENYDKAYLDKVLFENPKKLII